MVDITNYHEREALAVNAIKRNIPPELRKRIIAISEGGFSTLSRIEDYHRGFEYEVTAVDGVGTKPIIAIAMNKYDTIGINAVAMVANDIATWGNVFLNRFINQISCQYKIEEEEITGEIMKGIVKGLTLADEERIKQGNGVIIAGGETASIDEMLDSPIAGYSFDIAASFVGHIRSADAACKTIEPCYYILGFRSFGSHCNGYANLRHGLLKGDFEERKKIRKLYKGRYCLDDKMYGTDQTIGEILLEPTRIYSQVMRKLGERYSYIQGANITGYGLKNFNRIGAGVEYHITDPFESQPIFQLYQDETGESDYKMYEIFNMGLGFAIMIRPEHFRGVIEIALGDGMDIKNIRKIGEVRKSPDLKSRTILYKDDKEITFEGYQ